jgi:hypothetical protein
MKLSGFIVALLFSTLANAQSACVEFFKNDSQLGKNTFLTRELESAFLSSSIYQRLDLLEQVSTRLLQKIEQSPRPGLLRWFTFEGVQQRRATSELRALSVEVKQLTDAYKVVNSLLHGQVKRHNLKRDDELQLLNRLISEREMLDVLKFLDLRQSDVKGQDRFEQHFIDAVILYLAWGPNPKKFPVPIKSWLIFDIFLGHEDPKYMVYVASQFREMAYVYKDAKRGLTMAEASLEEYSVLMQDRVFALIERTEKKNPQVIERLIDQEIERGHIVLDDSGELRIVDDSL